MRRKIGKGKRIMIGWICVAIAVVSVVVTMIWIVNRERTVGKDIIAEDITEFVYTRSASSAPPCYQRYRFYREDGTWMLYHETRKDSHWPLTEADIISSGSIGLTDSACAEWMAYLNGGMVKKRTKHTEAGGKGPWMYLYWNGDRSKYQEFSFASFTTRSSFEAYCEALVLSAHSEEE